MKKIEAWQCGFCTKCSSRRGAMLAHENACKNNPARRHCITCVHGVSVEDAEIPELLTVQSYMPWNESSPVVYAGPWCDHHNMPIGDKPYFVDCETADIPHGGQICRPGTCYHYEYKGYAGWEAPENTGRVT